MYNSIGYAAHGVGALEAPEDIFITADCGCEIYEGEEMYEWDGKTLCSDCFDDKFSEMTRREKAALLGCDVIVVSEADRM